MSLLEGHEWCAIGIYGCKQYRIAEKHFFIIDIGPILRVQINSNDGYGVYYPIGPSLTFPVIASDNRFGVKRTTFSVCLKAALQYQYQVSDKWRIGLHGSI